ncbi:MAG: glycosyltransferase family 39 protein [Acidobacteria bacterium]|nr:glycosyltransferase family 39 protein [Acidobacteriota bacterium]
MTLTFSAFRSSGIAERSISQAESAGPYTGGVVTVEETLGENPEASGRLLFALALAAGLLLRLVQLGTPDLFGPDEGAWAIGARNLAEGGLTQLLELSRTPFGEPAGTPVFFPWMLSLALHIFGPEEWAIRLPSVYAGLMAAFVLERAVKRGYGQPAGHFAGAFAALFSPLVLASRAATVETTLMCLGLLGIIFGLRAFEEDLPAEAAVSAVFFGLGFLAKGVWIFIFLGPLLLALFSRPTLFGLGRTKTCFAVFLTVFLLVGGAHLLLVWWLKPELLALNAASAFGNSESWNPPLGLPSAFNADIRSVVRALAQFMPLAGAGVVFLLRPLSEAEVLSGATEGRRRLGHGILWGSYGAGFLVFFALSGRFQLSAIPVMPAVAVLAGLGGAALMVPAETRGRRRFEGNFALLSGGAVLALAAYLMTRPNDPLFGGPGLPLKTSAVLGSIGAATAILGLLGFGFFRARVARRVIFVYLSGLLVFAGFTSFYAVKQELLTHRTFAREIAEQIAPLILPLPPEQPGFRSPDPDAISFRLFRTGRSWLDPIDPDSMRREIRSSPVRIWAYQESMDPGPLAPSRAVRIVLDSLTIDVSEDVAARAKRPTDMKVMVYPASPPRS